jgi:protein-S-isoprenylcysteine O-methyltransferase Ste14
VAQEHSAVGVGPAATVSGRAKPSRALHDVSKWVRRFRRYIAVPLAALTLIGLRPLLPAGSLFMDDLTDWLGIGIALLGQGLRGWAWGSNAPARTQGVRTRGPYALVRHPLYVGNVLIAWGLLLIFHNPWAYLFCGLSFMLLYRVVIVVEEQQMEERTGESYRQYVASGVPRYVPDLRRLPEAVRTSAPFSWRLAGKKEYESVLGLVAGAGALLLYEKVWQLGVDAAWAHVMALAVMLGCVAVLAVSLYIRKRLQRAQRTV